MQGANSADRLIIAEKADGSGKSFAVGYTGALPNGIKDGSQIVITGTLQQSGSIAATNIALAQGQ
jgi:cytochrome c-type biogenesis protein CcmE